MDIEVLPEASNNTIQDIPGIIFALLIQYQVRSKTPDSSMGNLLKLINKCSNLNGFPDIVPKSLYHLTKSMAVKPVSMQFICSKCKKLTMPVKRQQSKKYDNVICQECSTVVDPIREIQSCKGYFVNIEAVEKIKRLLENPYVRKDVKFCNFDQPAAPITFGRFCDGRIYKKEMSNGDLSLTMFSDGVNLYDSSSKNLWPLFITINEFTLSLKLKFTFPIALFCGETKPDGGLMMDCVKNELKSLADGVEWSKDGKIVNTKVSCFNC